MDSKLNKINFYVNDGKDNQMHISDIICNYIKDNPKLLQKYCIYRDYLRYAAK